MKIIAIDTETYPIGLVVPKGAKRAKCNRNPVPRLVCMTVFDGECAWLLRGADAVDYFATLIADDDVKVVGHNLAFDVAVMARAGVSLADIFRAYDRGRFADTLIRELLIDIGTSGIDGRKSYALAGLVKNRLGRDIGASKSGPDVWRTRYNELDPLPTSQWPQAAVDYALDDARLTRGVYCSQQQPAWSALDTQIAGDQGVKNEQLQTAADFCMHLMSIWGLRVDEPFARKLDARFETVRVELGHRLAKLGLVRANGTENREEVQRLYGAAFASVGIEPPRTDKGAISLSAEARQILDEAGYEDERLDLLVEYNRIGKFRSTYMEPILMAPPYALCPRYGLVASGRSSSSGPNIQNFPKRDRKSDTLRASDIRRCFIPRDGNVFIDADYSTLELRTLAQVNLNLGLGHCHMAEALVAGRDLHTDFAAQLLQTTYEDATAAIAAGDGRAERARALAKVANFGFPGGLQAQGFSAFARGYGAEVSDAEAAALHDHWLARWSEMGPLFEYVRQHMRWDGLVPIRQHGPDRDAHGTWRVRLCPSVPAATNTLFQGMAADGAKFAMLAIWRACYVDERSPLFGFRPCAFIHDEFLLEGPEERATAAADELVRLMQVGMAVMVPDIPIEATAAVGRRWDVKMKSERLASGELSIYEGGNE